MNARGADLVAYYETRRDNGTLPDDAITANIMAIIDHLGGELRDARRTVEQLRDRDRFDADALARARREIASLRGDLARARGERSGDEVLRAAGLLP